MKKKYTLLGLLLLFTVLSFGQAPTLAWTYELPYYSTNLSIAVADDGTVYLGTDGKSSDPSRGEYNIFAIKNGSLSWGYLTDQVVRSSPSIADDGTIYFADYNGDLVAMNPDGMNKWVVDLGALVKYSSPAIAADGTIYIGMEDDDILHAIRPEDGSIKWSFPVGDDIRATPVVDSSGVIYIASSDNYFYAINPDGTEKWKSFYGDYTAGAPAIVESINTIYLSAKTSDNVGHLIALNMTTGSINWDNGSRPDAKLEQGGPTVAMDGTIYVGGQDAKMMAYNPDGSVKWTFNTAAGSQVLAAPALDNDGNLYFGDTLGNFYVVNSSGSIAYDTSSLDENIRSSAAIGNDGTIYILTRDDSNFKGTLYALTTTATSLLNSEWPMLSRTSGHSGMWDSVLSTNKESINGFSVYPNPVNNGEFYIATTLNEDKLVQIFDMLGKQVYSKKIIANEKIKSSHLGVGVYLLKVSEGDKIATSRLVIK